MILWHIEQLYEYLKAITWKFCLYFPLKIICSVRITHCWLEFLRIYILFSDFQGRIQEFLIGGRGGPNFGSERTVELFCAKLLLTERTTSFLICERRLPLAWKILLFDQRRAEHRRMPKHNYIFEYPKSATRVSLRKISQLKSDMRSCRCKDFCLKQAWGLKGVRALPTLPLDLPLMSPFLFFVNLVSKMTVSDFFPDSLNLLWGPVYIGPDKFLICVTRLRESVQVLLQTAVLFKGVFKGVLL